MNDNKTSILRGAKALHEHKAMPDKSKVRDIIADQTAEFLAKGNEIQEISANLYRSAEEVSIIAASQRNSLNKTQLKAHNKRVSKHQSTSAAYHHLKNRTSLPEVVK